ncbi:MAG: hypothetical protein FD148_1021 [Methylocystaceae bacterium]|nr:MAG: hypothetical protein FD148_1021 [Methylocystaceae bacterium]
MGTFDLLIVGQVLFLLTMANGVPVLGKRLFGRKMTAPLDCGLILNDGQPLFGKSKTIRGAVLAIIVTTMFSPLIGLEFLIGALVSAAAMIGDLFSSFVKRRLKMPSSSKATGLDQIPEALLPALLARCLLPLTLFDISAIVFLFFIGNSFFRSCLRDEG